MKEHPPELTAIFRGGPWDGVEVKAAFLPDAIAFRHMTIGSEGEGRNFEFSWSTNSSLVYLLEFESETERHYRFAPGERAWWETSKD